LEEGITEAGSMASFIAAGSATRRTALTHSIFIYYSMFGFQRIGDFIGRADMRTRGFMLAAPRDARQLSGEGLRIRMATATCWRAVPNVKAYDPALHSNWR